MNDKERSALAHDAEKRWRDLKFPPVFAYNYDGGMWGYAVVAKKSSCGQEGCYALMIYDFEGKFVTNMATAILEHEVIPDDGRLYYEFNRD